MTIYRLRSNHEDYMTFTVPPKELRSKMGDDFTYHFNRSPIPQTPHWNTPNGKFYLPSDYKNAIKLPDITDWTICDMVLNEKSYHILSPLLKNYGEFLTVSVEAITYYVFNVLKIVELDGINEKKSKQKFYEDSYDGLISLEFKQEKIKDLLLFRTSYDDYLNIYCQDELKNIINENNLKGIVFKTDLAGLF